MIFKLPNQLKTFLVAQVAAVNKTIVKDNGGDVTKKMKVKLLILIEEKILVSSSTGLI